METLYILLCPKERKLHVPNEVQFSDRWGTAGYPMNFRTSPTLPFSLHWSIFILIFKYEGRLSTFRNLRYYWSLTPRRSSENLCDQSDPYIRRSNIPINILIMTWHQRKRILKTNKNLMRNNSLKIW
jgi:hypothetical protein